MKFVKHYMESIAGIEIYPLISLCIFFLFFIALIGYVIKLKKSYVETMELLPVDNENTNNNVDFS